MQRDENEGVGRQKARFHQFLISRESCHFSFDTDYLNRGSIGREYVK
jgi:hypothetical protein